jgi:ribonuclease HI
LPFTENITILGLTFDSKLTWKPHILKTKKSAYKNLRVIKTLSHLEWGAEYSILLNLYRTLVRSKLDYGSICYGNSNCNLSKILDPVHNTGIRCAIGAFRSSPISSLLAITGEPPLQYRRLRLSLKYITRILSTPDNSTIHYLNINQSPSVYDLNTNLRKPLSTRFRKEMSDNNISPNTILQYETCLTPPWSLNQYEIDTSFSTHVKKETPEIVYRSLFNELIHTDTDNHNNTQIYTDASKTSTGIGLAVIHKSSTQVFQLNSYSSIYTAEYIALLKVVQTAVNTNYERIHIFSDSLSVLSNIKYNTQINPLVTKIKNIIHLSNKYIRFIWTPGHCNIRGNEEADKAARNAISNPNYLTLSLMSPADIIRNVDKYCMQLWDSDWRQVTDNKLREIKHSVEPWPKLNFPNRKENVIIKRLRIGHTRVTHGYLMEKTEPPICRSCNSPMTVKHIIIHCQIFTEARKECKIPDNLYEAIGPYADIPKIISFVKKIEMYNLI